MLQRSCSGICSGDASCADCRKKPLQRHATGNAPASVPPIVHEVLQSPGAPLDRETRDHFEPQFGIVFDGVSRVNPTSGGLTVGPAGTPFEHEASRIASRVTTPAPALEPRFRYDFSKVRIHTDDRATQAARSVGAKAFTVGHDVVFGAGHYAPESSTGRELLAHELTHVLQQSGDSVMLQRQLVTPQAAGGGFRGLLERDRSAMPPASSGGTAPSMRRIKVWFNAFIPQTQISGPPGHECFTGDGRSSSNAIHAYHEHTRRSNLM